MAFSPCSCLKAGVLCLVLSPFGGNVSNSKRKKGREGGREGEKGKKGRRRKEEGKKKKQKRKKGNNISRYISIRNFDF